MAEPTSDNTTAPRWQTVLVWLARVAVAATFVAAALPKIADLPGFAADIAAYQAFPHQSWHLLAGLVPMLELVGAAALMTGIKRRAGAVLLGVMTVSFLVLIASVIIRGIDLNCGCFGHDEQAAAVGWPLFWRDVALLVGIVVGAWEPRARQST